MAFLVGHCRSRSGGAIGAGGALPTRRQLLHHGFLALVVTAQHTLENTEDSTSAHAELCADGKAGVKAGLDMGGFGGADAVAVAGCDVLAAEGGEVGGFGGGGGRVGVSVVGCGRRGGAEDVVEGGHFGAIS